MGRVVIVSNRVGSFTPRKGSEGGLVTAIRAAFLGRDLAWFGWSGVLADEPNNTIRVEREDGLTRLLVDLKPADYKGYYLGFANRVLWPLFHYRVGLSDFDQADYAAYLRVNEIFADRLTEALQPDDIIWIHDYHLIPLATALRRRGVNQRIGFFLHIPFPAPEVLATLPVHKELVQALFDYDLVGLQTEGDLQAFSDYVERQVGGIVYDDGEAMAFGRRIRTGAFPISIEVRAVAGRAERSAHLRQVETLRDSLSGRRLIIGVDRVDYTKGLRERLAAVEQLLERFPEHRRDTVMMQIAPLSREDVPEYQQIRTEIDAAVGRIHGRFAEPHQLPIRYINRNFSQDVLFSFYRASRVGLVTPLRDGMNLVSKEYIASQDPADPGVLILSCFAGAAAELDAALIVNPYSIDEVVQALRQALAMPLDERRTRHAALLSRIRTNDIHRWRRDFLNTLETCGIVSRPSTKPYVSAHCS